MLFLVFLPAADQYLFVRHNHRQLPAAVLLHTDAQPSVSFVRRGRRGRCVCLVLGLVFGRLLRLIPAGGPGSLGLSPFLALGLCLFRGFFEDHSHAPALHGVQAAGQDNTAVELSRVAGAGVFHALVPFDTDRTRLGNLAAAEVPVGKELQLSPSGYDRRLGQLVQPQLVAGEIIWALCNRRELLVTSEQHRGALDQVAAETVGAGGQNLLVASIRNAHLALCRHRDRAKPKPIIAADDALPLKGNCHLPSTNITRFLLGKDVAAGHGPARIYPALVVRGHLDVKLVTPHKVPSSPLGQFHVIPKRRVLDELSRVTLALLIDKLFLPEG